MRQKLHKCANGCPKMFFAVLFIMRHKKQPKLPLSGAGSCINHSICIQHLH